MQFGIRTLLIVTTAVAALCGVVFAAPPIVAVPILCAILWVCPSVWINGIVYARSAWRPFFIGGMSAGIVPHLAALYYSVMIVVASFGGDSFGDLAAAAPWGNLFYACILLGPGVFAFLGGACGVVVYRLHQPPRSSAALRLAAGEYLVVSGRLTTAPAPHEANATYSGRTESPRTA